MKKAPAKMKKGPMKMKKAPAKMKKAPMKKALSKAQKTLPVNLQKEILAAPNKMLKPADMKLMKGKK